MSDVIKFKCKSCEKKITARLDYAGKKVKCPGCKQPLRVPSPRPKRSSTGVPIASESGDNGSSSASTKSYSLADLAEMEANADAEIKELYHKGQSTSVRIPNGKDCPECASSCKKDAVLCVTCGHNFESGKQTKPAKQSMLGGLFKRKKD